MSELVSVLMPIAPRSAWLGQAVSSLIAQTHQDWLLVAVLDGECDQNRAVLQQPQLSGRIRVKVVPPGSGVARALNTGLEASSTELVARFDSDDICEPERLRTQIAEMRARPELVVLGSSAAVIDERGRKIGMLSVPVGPERVRRQLLWRNAVIHPSAVLRREQVLRAGGYDPTFVRAQDYELWLRMSRRGLLDNLASPLLRYRRHSQQHSRPITEPAETMQLRLARRRAAGSHPGRVALSDARHFAWLTVQHVKAWQRG
ncbi:glycosyltransferase [Micromonospora sp. IBHARD004]|uniref:glycosyltransferase n=1 Tax=Micromonospora sp. IBHARD004 TaxID=3457764 RepID=UPI004057EDE9